SSLEPRQYLLAGDNATEHGVAAVEVRTIGQRHVDLAVGQRGIPRMRESNGAARVQPLLRDLRRADRFSARGVRAASPLGLERQVAGPRIAPLHDEAGERAVHALPVVEAAPHELDDVRHGPRRLVRKRLELERAFRRFDDDDRAERLSPKTNTETAENAEY